MEDDSIPQEIPVVPYKPFPGFAEWSSIDVNLTTVDAYSARILDAKNHATNSQLQAAVKIATKWAAVDTGAIEGLYNVDRGFTYSVALSATAWSNIHKVKSESVARSIEDAIIGYDLVLDAATLNTPISEHWIKELHAVLCASQDTYTVVTDLGSQERDLPKGQYKTLPNNPFNLESNTVHNYASPIDTSPEMARLVDELRKPEFTVAHPVIQASYAHYAFVCIHPFPDGNGRVSRALASVFLYRNPGIPLVIFADQRSEYFDSLERADQGDLGGFIRFIADRTVDTIGMVEAQMVSAAQPNVVQQQLLMEGTLTSRGGLPYVVVDDIANRLVDIFRLALLKQTEENPLKHPLSSQIFNGGGNSGPIPSEYRYVPGQPPIVGVVVRSATPADGTVQRTYGVSVARPGVELADFILSSNGRVLLEVFLREIYPSLTASLTFRVDSVALGEFQSMVSEVNQQAVESLRKNGYLN